VTLSLLKLIILYSWQVVGNGGENFLDQDQDQDQSVDGSPGGRNYFESSESPPASYQRY
jgi:hypothetical protein